MGKLLAATCFVAIAALSLLPGSVLASAGAGDTVRNVFGPDVGLGANQCRGACGGGCPKTCRSEVRFECLGDTKLRRVNAFICGTHQGCRDHDDCLDACLRNSPEDRDCQSECNAMVVERYGFDKSTPWLLGKGPYDGEITFEYTRYAPEAPEPLYRCPPGAIRQCGADGPCVGPNDGRAVDAIFDSYPAASTGAMQISGLRAGPLCDAEERVCEQSLNIKVGGDSRCPNGPCTRFGLEFEYRNANPVAALECRTSTRSNEDDFVGDLIKLGGDAIAEKDAASGGPDPEDGLGQLLGAFSKVIASADSPEDLQVTITPLDEDGNPDESRRVGTGADGVPPPIPTSVELPRASGRLVVQMYQLASGGRRGTIKERRVTCTHQGEPVLETVFVLRY
ncbi:hypothetical protein FV139_00275 [Parahaliea maris]|uniref:Uncharacterized protein n=1 Tax=Parahaliea maris TaxID=2716870 RepID=A0A5C9A7H7_9GAMM|nr:hypothetical protein [Parahaliea maris]TXS95984.1 hypothetical protein FV139_00275 [Parahaliea maris]